MKKVLLILFLFVYSFVFGQNQKKMDSLQTFLNAAKEDTTRLRLYIVLVQESAIENVLQYSIPAVQIADKLLSQKHTDIKKRLILKQKAFALLYTGFFYYRIQSNIEKYIDYTNKSIVILSDIKDTLIAVDAILSIGYAFSEMGNIPKALEYCQRGMNLSKELNYKKGIAFFLMQMGRMCADKGDTLQALENFQRVLSIRFELKDTIGQANALARMGQLYGKLHNLNKALDYLNKGKLLYEQLKNQENIALAYNWIGDVYQENNQLSNAILNYQKSLLISNEIKNEKWIITLLNSIGNVYTKQGFFSEAIKKHLAALKISLEFKDKTLTSQTYYALANAYNKQKDFVKAKNYILLALDDKDNRISILSLRDNQLLAAKIDSSIGDGINAYEHYKEYVLLRDKLNTDELSKAATREKFQEEADKQKLEQDKKDAITAAESKKQKVITGSVIVGLLLVLVFAGFVVRSLRVSNKQKKIIEIKSKETEEQKNIIEEKNRDITDSITYAKRIQQAKLPKKEEIFAALPNCFVLFKPKDIVSGDFYFFHKNEQSLFIAAADCTGHGVPGAFMSMIGSERLEDAVSNSNDTSQILQLLNKGIKTSLRQSDSDESTRDGMDIAICSVDPVNRIVKYAGANRPLYIIRKGQTEIEEIKATKKAIGGLTEDNQYFDAHELQLQKGDTFYISTDGYADQFSGQDKKLTTKKFKQVLLEIQDKSMQDQEIHLDNFIEDWKTGIEQIDDILVIGVRL